MSYKPLSGKEILDDKVKTVDEYKAGLKWAKGILKIEPVDVIDFRVEMELRYAPEQPEIDREWHRGIEKYFLRVQEIRKRLKESPCT